MTKTNITRRGALSLGLAAAACAPQIETPAYDGVVRFAHGVASGDPKADRVIIWTRVSAERAGPVPVRWIVARNRELTDVVKAGVAEANETRDYTVKVDVTGLRPGAPYFYGFRAGDQQSDVGKTRTLHNGRLDKLVMGVVSCASYPHGFFNAYQALARQNDLDLVVHLGDYIYEYGLNGYGGDQAIALGRVPSPEVECLSLADYRLRHAQARGEAELQAAHARCAWICVWDDHEVANDSWSGGSENHNQGEGDWTTRKRAALQAYYEWLPIREPEAGKPFEAINRSFQFGDLLTLIMVETRLLARTHQIEYSRQLPLVMQRWDFANPNAPRPQRDGDPDAAAMRQLPALFEEVGGNPVPVIDWRRVGPALANPTNLPRGFHFAPDLVALNALLSTPDRTLLGPAQEEWLGQELMQSKRNGVTWQVLGNQVVMAPVAAPDLTATPPALAQRLEQLRPGVTKLIALTRYPIPLNTDAWDGYPAARARVYAKLREANGSAIVLSGDSHTAWANELNDAQGRVGVEFGATSITSPSDAQYFEGSGVDFSGGVRARNPHIKWTEAMNRGFIKLTLTKRYAQAEFHTVSTIRSKDFATATAASFTVAPNAGAGIGPITPAQPPR